MRGDNKIFSLAIITVFTIVLEAPAYAGADMSTDGIKRIIASSSIPAEPGVMVIVGIALLAIRVLIARKSRQRRKDPTHGDTKPARFGRLATLIRKTAPSAE